MLFAHINYYKAVEVATSALCLYVSGWIIYCRFFHPLRDIPGPFLASISRIWIVFNTGQGNMEHTQRALHKKYGYLVRIAPNEVSCSDPDAIKTIYSTKNVFLKSEFYAAWAPPKTQYVGHFPVRDEKQHSERRRIINNVFSMSSILDSEKAIDVCTENFCATVREFAKNNTTVELNYLTNMYALEGIGNILFGKHFKSMTKRNDHILFFQALDTLLWTFTMAGTVPSYLTQLFFVSTVLFSASFRACFRTILFYQKTSEDAVSKSKEELEDNLEHDESRDVMRKMLEIHADRGEKLNFKVKDVSDEAHSSLFAGADSTAIAINSVFYHLMRTPEAYEKLTSEIDAAVANGSLSLPVAYKEAISLPYLKACINEAMRLHPSVGLPLQRLVPAGGATISGFHFPGGYNIGINAAVVQYDKDVFGPDADIFNPDRWLESNGERDVSLMHRTMIHFGAGTRTCIGQNISLSEIHKLVPHVVRLFHIRLVDPSKEWKTHNYWFNRQTGINVYFEERSVKSV